jgi:hypothetical protein
MHDGHNPDDQVVENPLDVSQDLAMSQNGMSIVQFIIYSLNHKEYHKYFFHIQVVMQCIH